MDDEKFLPHLEYCQKLFVACPERLLPGRTQLQHELLSNHSIKDAKSKGFNRLDGRI